MLLRFVASVIFSVSVLSGCTPEPKGGEKCEAGSGTLPAAGSACASAGEVCKPAGEDVCAPGPFVECEGGVWVEKPGVPADDCGETTAPTGGVTDGTTGGGTTTNGPQTTTEGTTGGVACDPQDLPEPGTPCAMEGQFCSPGCEDPCQFCNVLECEGGKWTNIEAQPAPCASCEEICPSTVAAMCPGGPPDEPACVSGCMDVMAGPCGLLHSQTRACAGPQPTITCDAMGRPTVIGCEAQFDDLYECLGI